MIYVAGWKATHRPIDLPFQMAFTFTVILKFNGEQVTLIKSDIVDEGEFSPPVGRCRMFEQLVINIGYELVVAKPIEFARAHFNPSTEMSPVLWLC